MTEPLFIKRALTKQAAGNRKLNTDPTHWVEDLTQTLYAAHPYLQQYRCDIDIKQSDPETGMLFATAVISPQVQPAAGGDLIGIPLFAVNWQIKPVDVMAVNQGFQPLSQERLEQVFPQLQMGDPVTPPGGTSNSNLTPLINSPAQTLGTGGTGGFGDSPKYASLMQAISGTIDRDDVEAFVKEAGDPDVLEALRTNCALQEVFSRVDAFVPTDPFPEMAAAARELIEPTVMQVYRGSDGVHVKSASAAVYDPIDRLLTATEFDTLAADLKGEVLRNNFATFVVEHEKRASEKAEDAVAIDSVCGCEVYEPGEGPRIGVSVPAIRVDGSKAGIVWFNKEAHTCQDRIAGVVVEGKIQTGQLLKVASAERAGGHGTFMWEYKGDLTALEPMDVKYSSHNNGVHAFVCTTESGRPCTLRKVAGVTGLVQLKDGSGDLVTILPSAAQWIPLAGKDIALQKSPTVVKAAAKLDMLLVKVAGTGTHWTISGEPVAGVPLEDRNQVNRAGATFVLGALGVQPDEAADVLTKAARAPQSVSVPWEVQSKAAMEKYAEAIGERYASLFRTLRRPGHSLLKVAAAALQDTGTLDSVLSLGFLNPQNLETFLGYLPELEDALHQVCELLVAARLGLGVGETELKTCMESMSHIISDLQYMTNEAQEPFTPVNAGGPQPISPFSSGAQPSQQPGQPGQAQGAPPQAAAPAPAQATPAPQAPAQAPAAPRATAAKR